MATVISATTKFAGRPSGAAGRKQSYLNSAYHLMNDARNHIFHGKVDAAVESAYQAALRCAGARVADSPLAKRKRLPSSAWDRLAMVGVAEKEWADKFRGYSRMRSRLLSGLTVDVDAGKARELMALAAAFIDEVDHAGGAADVAA